MKEDIIWLDYARVIGIFLVILGHVEQHFPSFLITDLVLKDVWHIIYLFHMPLFFIISGYLFSGKKNDRVSFSFIYGNIRMLLVSYLIYQIVYIPLILKNHSEEICNGAFWVKVLLGIVIRYSLFYMYLSALLVYYMYHSIEGIVRACDD